MTISQQIDTDLAASMKAGNSIRTGVLRLLRSSFKNEQIKLGRELTEAEVLKVLQRESKQRRDSITAYTDAKRADLAEIEAGELAIIAEYLPPSLSEDELGRIVDEVVSGFDNASPAVMGQIIGAVMARVGATAEGGAVAKAVRERLA